MTAATRWEHLTSEDVVFQYAQKPTVGNTLFPYLTLASATETYAHAHAQRCNGSLGSPIKTEKNGLMGLQAQTGRFSCMRRQKYW